MEEIIFEGTLGNDFGEKLKIFEEKLKWKILGTFRVKYEGILQIINQNFQKIIIRE